MRVPSPPCFLSSAASSSRTLSTAHNTLHLGGPMNELTHSAVEFIGAGCMAFVVGWLLAQRWALSGKGVRALAKALLLGLISILAALILCWVSVGMTGLAAGATGFAAALVARPTLNRMIRNHMASRRTT